MFNSKLVAFVFASGVFGLVSCGWAQGPSAQSGQGVMPQSAKQNTFFDDLDELGHNIFGGILPSDDKATRRNNGRSAAKKTSSSQDASSSDDASGGTAAAPATKDSDDDYPTPRSYKPTTKSYVAPNRPQYGSQYGGVSPSAGGPGARASAGVSRPVATEASTFPRDGNNSADVPTSQGSAATPNVPGLRPLHERLSQFRHSEFADEAPRNGTTSAGTTPGVAPLTPGSGEQRPTSPMAAARTENAGATATTSGLPADRTMMARRGLATSGAQNGLPAAGVPTPAVRPPVTAAVQPPAAQPPIAVVAQPPVAQPPIAVVAQPPVAQPPMTAVPQPPVNQPPITAVPQPPVTQSPVTAVAPTRATSAPPVAAGNIVTAPAVAPTRAPSTPATSASGQRQDNVLIARKSPILGVQTVGPPRIMVGRESTYVIVATNSGEVAAEDTAVLIKLPASADVVGVEASIGAAQPVLNESGRTLQWRIGQLAARGKERLMLRIIPRESRPIDLAVRWECRPATSEATIEVQEAKLSLHMDGPRDVVYGKKELFTLKLANTGNGDAENVMLSLLPVGTGENKAASHNMGVIAAGEEKTIDVELTPRQSGNLLIQVDAKGDFGVHAELAETVTVRRATLRVDVEGPQVQYVGAVAAYKIRVSNAGNAPARNVRLSASVPPGGKYLSGIAGGRLDASGVTVQWLLDSLGPAAEQVYVIKCALGRPGANKVEVVSMADDDLTAAAVATTRVEAMADLVLEVKDPARPIPVGEEVLYELRVRNRGTKTAEGVEVLAFFSRGIEPIAAEGVPNKAGAGQVAFEPIPAVAAGETVTLTIRARADAAGNHIFRAEVHCKPLGTRLVSEQTTHYYADSNTLPQNVRTADRREATPPPVQGQPTLAPVRK